ncbi:MAG: hypothetical protein ACFE8M_14220 [Candidatus Hermodarchaeota archaeon]
MSKFQNFEQKLSKSYLDFLNSGIRNNIIFPCHLGIIFFNNTHNNLFEKLNTEINNVFDGFFFEVMSIEIKNDYSLFINNLERIIIKGLYKDVFVYPSNYFYEVLSDFKIKNNLNIGLGITTLPLYSSNRKNLIFLYGEAHLRQNCAVVSSYNLKSIPNSQEDDKIHLRLIKEAIHEIGHIVLGAGHCLNKLCVMNFSKNIEEIDKKSLKLCPDCQLELELLRAELNF